MSPPNTPGVRAALVERLRQSGDEMERAKRAFAAPYSSHDAAVAYHTAVGVRQGLGLALAIFDALDSGEEGAPNG